MKALNRWSSDFGKVLGQLYGWNTLGACSGVLLCEFLFLPWVGHDRTLLFMVAANETTRQNSSSLQTVIAVGEQYLGVGYRN